MRQNIEINSYILRITKKHYIKLSFTFLVFSCTQKCFIFIATFVCSMPDGMNQLRFMTSFIWIYLITLCGAITFYFIFKTCDICYEVFKSFIDTQGRQTIKSYFLYEANRAIYIMCCNLELKVGKTQKY